MPDSSYKFLYFYVIVWVTQMPNSNTDNTLVPRLATASLLHANTNMKKGLLCYHKSLTKLKGSLVKLGVSIGKI